VSKLLYEQSKQSFNENIVLIDRIRVSGSLGSCCPSSFGAYSACYFMCKLS